MRRGLAWGPLPQFHSRALCLPPGSSPSPPALSSPSLPAWPHRYGGFSLGGRDPSLPSGQELGHSVEELWALLSPLPGGALDRVLNNLTAWTHSLDSQDSLKVGTGGDRWVSCHSKVQPHFPDPMTLTPTQIWFNNKGWHSMVAFVNRANNALLRAHLPPGSARHTHSITTLNHPLNLTKEQLSEAAL